MSYFDDIYHIDSSMKHFIANYPIDESKFTKFTYMLWKSFIKANLSFHSEEGKYTDQNINDATLGYVLDFFCYIYSSECENYRPEDIVPLLKEDQDMADYCKRLISSPSKSDIHNPNFIKSALCLAFDEKNNYDEDIEGVTQLSDYIAESVFKQFKSKSCVEKEISKNLYATYALAKKWHEPSRDIEKAHLSQWDLNKITRCMYASHITNEVEDFWLLLFVTETDELSMVFQCSVNDSEVFNYQLRDIYYESNSEPPENILDFYINKTINRFVI